MERVEIADITEEAPGFTTGDSQTALEWMAVIASLGGDYFARCEDRTWIIHVPPDQFSFFEKQIADYEHEREIFTHKLARQAEHMALSDETSYSAFHAVLILLVFHLISGPSDMNGPLIEAGAFAISEFFQGQWWRPVTALMLHADTLHWASNAMFLLFFAPSLCKNIGASATWLALLLCGIAGNCSTALLYTAPHRSIGSSTSVFAALGLLAGLATLHRIRHNKRLAYRAGMAGVAMLALTGLNPASDILAHIFGFIYGMIAALPVKLLRLKKRSLAVRCTVWMIIAIILVTAWNHAISYIPHISQH